MMEQVAWWHRRCVCTWGSIAEHVPRELICAQSSTCAMYDWYSGASIGASLRAELSLRASDTAVSPP